MSWGALIGVSWSFDMESRKKRGSDAELWMIVVAPEIIEQNGATTASDIW
jgi:hypothetical protein